MNITKKHAKRQLGIAKPLYISNLSPGGRVPVASEQVPVASERVGVASKGVGVASRRVPIGYEAWCSPLFWGVQCVRCLPDLGPKMVMEGYSGPWPGWRCRPEGPGRMGRGDCEIVGGCDHFFAEASEEVRLCSLRISIARHPRYTGEREQEPERTGKKPLRKGW